MFSMTSAASFLERYCDAQVIVPTSADDVEAQHEGVLWEPKTKRRRCRMFPTLKHSTNEMDNIASVASLDARAIANKEIQNQLPK